jgi:TonB-linked SusC/RagA family outer membrane protein
MKKLPKTFLLIALSILNTGILSAQLNPILDTKTDLKPGQYKLQQLIEAITSKNINVTYNASSLPLESMVAVKTDGPMVKELLETIQTTLSIEYHIKGDFLILKKKKSKVKYKVTGVIMNSVTNEPLIGASIYIKGSYYGGTSNADGVYNLQLPADNYVLVASYIGFETIEKPIELIGDLNLNIALVVSNNKIDEVKVTKQRNFWRNLDVGRNISTLDSKKIETLNTNNAADILQASMPGVWSTQSSGAPGDHQKVKIRGINSIFGCTDPLYIIDGVAVPIVNLHSLGIADLNIHDIESITVLKDASSNAIYGYQGGNGVIIVDTKRGGESHISFSTKMGIQRVPRKLDLMNIKDFLTSLDSATNNKIVVSRKYYPEDQDTLKNTDWQNELFRDGILNEYQLSGSGKIGKTSFYLSGNYYTHQGIINTSTYKRYNATANFGRNITSKLSAEINIRSSLQKNTNNLDTYNGNDVIIKGINTPPMFKSLDDSFYYYPRHDKIDDLGNLLDRKQVIANRNFYYYPLISQYPNSKIPIDSLLHSNTNTLDVQSNTFDIRLKYFILDNLYANAASSLSLRNNIYQSDIQSGPNTNFMKSNEHYILFNQQININYQKYLNEHEILFTSGYRNYADNAYWKLDSITNRDHTENIYLKNSLALNADHGAVIRQIQSYSTLLNYNYSQKYLVSLVANYETLTVNKSYNIQALYPSASVSWDLSHEFLINRLTWLNECSIFANWGRVGNMPINALSEDVYGPKYRYTFNDTDILGIGVTQFANHKFKPEMITEYNLGVNIGLFNNRIRLMADYYYKTSDDLIAIRDIPFYYAGGRIIYNMGKLVNEGKEFSFDVDVVSSKNFNWSSNFAISTNMLRVKKINDVSQLQFYNSDILIPDFEVKENQELGVIKGFKYLGPWTDEDAKAKDKKRFNWRGNKYLKTDTVHVTALTDKDQVVVGKSMPDFTWHWQNTFEYRNFTLEILWYGVQGINKFNATKVSTFMAGTNRDVNNFLQYKNMVLTDSIFYQSSYFAEDASFIRLKQLTIAYNFPKKLLNKANVRISLSFDNFFTITKYTGYDPEATIYTDNSFSDYAVDRGAYPNPKSVYLTLNMDF